MFAELLARSSFSFLQGASQPEEMMSRAKDLGLGAIAICDQNGLYGVVRAFARAKETGGRLIVGAELDLAVPGCPVERTDAWRASDADPSAPDLPTVALLTENHAGYTNLCRLLTRAHAGLPKGEALLEVDAFAEHGDGLVAIVPGPRLPGKSGTPTDSILKALVDALGRDRVFAGAYRRLDGLDPERMEVVEGWSERFGIDIVASARPLYHTRSRKPLADVLHCIRTGTTLDRAGLELAANGEAFLRGEADMRRLFSDAEDWVDRAGEVAERLVFSLEQIRYDFPCVLAPGETADQALRRLVEGGKHRRYPMGVPDGVEAQLEKELRLIAEIKVAPYFLSTYEVVEIARARRILCQGRGSAANSAVCYVLGITAVDPARSNLLFERFLSVERHEPPDIDIDFEHERREEVIQEIYAKYGRDRAAMVSEVICYRGKSAIREVGKAFGLSLEQVDRLSGLLTHWDSVDEGAKRARQMGFDLDDDRLRKVLALSRLLEGFPRHLSIHVGGFVLSACPLSEVAPTEPARMVDRTVIPWDKDDIETLGFFKIDVLGLGMLTAIRKCLALLFEDGELKSGDEHFDPLEAITRIPPEDPVVYALASRGDTIGVFQIESRAQMAMLPRLRPQRFYDLVIEVAIVRPGPIQGGMVHPYLRRRNGEEAIETPHPDLWPILERTLGVPLFQEQVMQISIVGAGYTGGEADQLRRDMAAWKKSGRLLRHRDRLLEGFAKKGISRKFGEALFEQIKGFGDYGFPESHAASFALLVYASCWQKAHYPAHFACALLNSQPMGFYAPSTLVRDAQKHGVEVREVSITRSNWDSTLERIESTVDDPEIQQEAQGERARSEPRGLHEAPEKEKAGRDFFVSESHQQNQTLPVFSPSCSKNKALRLGFRLVKGFGESAGRAIETARAERPFSSLDDLVRRASLKKNEIEALAEAGALEDLVAGRRQALWKARAPRTKGLFESFDVREPEVKLPPLPRAEQLILDYGRKGLSVDDHPMKHLRARLRHRRVITAAELHVRRQGDRVAVAGLVLTRQRPGTASGVVFITLEDETGFSNLILYSGVFDRFYLAGRHASLLLARGKVEREVTLQRPGEVGEATAVVHLLVDHLERLDIPGREIESMSRDFH